MLQSTSFDAYGINVDGTKYCSTVGGNYSKEWDNEINGGDKVVSESSECLSVLLKQKLS